MILLSQDGLKAISASRVDFLVIPKDRNERGNFNLLVKTPTVSGNFYEYMVMFEHENLEVVKHVMHFLIGDTISIPNDAENKTVISIDIPNLYRYGMKEIAPELLTTKQARPMESHADLE